MHNIKTNFDKILGVVKDIVGSDDFFTPVADMKIIASEIKNSNLVIIENAGHMPNMEQPEIFNETISTFYRQLIP